MNAFYQEVQSAGTYKIVFKMPDGSFKAWHTSWHRNGKKQITDEKQLQKLRQHFVDYCKKNKLPDYEQAIVCENRKASGQPDKFLYIIGINGHLTPYDSNRPAPVDGRYFSKFRMQVTYDYDRTKQRERAGLQPKELIFNTPSVDSFEGVLDLLAARQGVTRVQFFENRNAKLGTRPISEMNIGDYSMSPEIF